MIYGSILDNLYFFASSIDSLQVTSMACKNFIEHELGIHLIKRDRSKLSTEFHKLLALIDFADFN
jgi:hypothetical protein